MDCNISNNNNNNDTREEKKTETETESSPYVLSIRNKYDVFQYIG